MTESLNNSDILSKLEEETLSQDDSTEVPPSDIVAYNELRSCADLYRMYTKNILNISPDFQREVVWRASDQTRFIDSLTKQLPIPSMCFALDYKLQKWMVIDGLQRISTIIKFLDEKPWILSELDDIDPILSGKSVQLIRDPNSPHHSYYSRVENLALPITILRCDFTKKSHMEYLFTIFHRLNTGGTKLNNQEIRNCIYSGELNSSLKKLDSYQNWRELNKMKPNDSQRFVKQELILRFLCFYDASDSYNGKLASFLNFYMYKNQHLSGEALELKEELFYKTVDVIYEKIFKKIPPKFSITILESLMVGIAWNITYLTEKSSEELNALLQQLLAEPEFSEAEMIEGLAQKRKVIERINKAKLVFSR